jgi:hypothetical protein
MHCSPMRDVHFYVLVCNDKARAALTTDDGPADLRSL